MRTPSTTPPARRSPRPATTSATGGEATSSTASRPGLVARPTSTDEVAEVLRAAAAHGLTVVPRGRGTKLSVGAAADVGATWSSTSPGWTRCSTTRRAT